jgi:hypothetical protein
MGIRDGGMMGVHAIQSLVILPLVGYWSSVLLSLLHTHTYEPISLRETILDRNGIVQCYFPKVEASVYGNYQWLVLKLIDDGGQRLVTGVLGFLKSESSTFSLAFLAIIAERRIAGFGTLLLNYFMKHFLKSGKFPCVVESTSSTEGFWAKQYMWRRESGIADRTGVPFHFPSDPDDEEVANIPQVSSQIHYL